MFGFAEGGVSCRHDYSPGSESISAVGIGNSSGLSLSCDDAWGGDIIAAACVHIGSTVDPSRFEGTWIAQEYLEGHYDSESPIKIDQGYIRVPSGPGSGVSPDADVFGSPIAVYSR
jgi:L-alanine-DL-glutamate epimerase-like enolase superfamily enzyme